MWWKELILIIVGFAGGSAVAGALYALIVKLGILTRLAAWTKTNPKMTLYGNCIIAGTIEGTLITIYGIHPPLGIPGQCITGVFFGIYTGCFYMALAESLNAVPIMIRRLKINKGAGIILLSMAIGKAVGSWLYFYHSFTGN